MFAIDQVTLELGGPAAAIPTGASHPLIIAFDHDVALVQADDVDFGNERVIFFPASIDAIAAAQTGCASTGLGMVRSVLRDALENTASASSFARHADALGDVAVNGTVARARAETHPPGAPYEIRRPDGTVAASGALDDADRIRIQRVPFSSCRIVFPSLRDETWGELSA